MPGRDIRLLIRRVDAALNWVPRVIGYFDDLTKT